MRQSEFVIQAIKTSESTEAAVEQVAHGIVDDSCPNRSQVRWKKLGCSLPLPDGICRDAPGYLTSNVGRRHWHTGYQQQMPAPQPCPYQDRERYGGCYH